MPRTSNKPQKFMRVAMSFKPKGDIQTGPKNPRAQQPAADESIEM